MTTKKPEVSKDQEIYGKLWKKLQKACRETGNNSPSATIIRAKMDNMWTEMSAEDRNSFYYTGWNED